MATLYGTSAGETLNGTLSADTLYGRGGNDFLYGYDGNDRLNGGPGADAMRGGLGNDTYYVDHTSDAVTELAGEGTDIVRTTVNFTLGSNVEQGVLQGTAAINLTGNELANTLTGNSAANSLAGAAGNDVLKGGGGVDTLEGGAGSDTLYGGAGKDIIAFRAGDGSDIVVDLAVGDTVNIYGYASAQSVSQVGSNVVAVFATGNQITFLGSTVATVQSALRFEGSGGTGGGTGNVINGTAGADYLAGGDAADAISGLGGNDVLAGYAGSDRLTGGSGSDTFVFTDLSHDTITDFTSGIDKIDLGWFVSDFGGSAFQFIGGNAFSGQAAQGRYANGLFQLDIDGDRTADLTISILGAVNAGDFVFAAYGYWDY